MAFDPAPLVPDSFLPVYYDIDWGVAFGAQQHWKEVSIPLWIPAVGAGIPTIMLWRADRRRRLRGCCRRCGYDLTGNVSGRCPECGTAIHAEAPRGG
jgi:hypothetical protein